MGSSVPHTPLNYPPYSAYKHSGIEWLGEIPAHWELRRLKYAARIEAGQSPPSDKVVDYVDDFPFLQGNAEFGPMSPSPRFACDEARKMSRPGNILLSARAPVGAINIADQAYGIDRGLCAVQPSLDFAKQFAYYLLVTTRSRLNESASGSTYDAVTASDVGDLPAILAPLPEQGAIAAYLFCRSSAQTKIRSLRRKLGLRNPGAARHRDWRRSIRCRPSRNRSQDSGRITTGSVWPFDLRPKCDPF